MAQAQMQQMENLGPRRLINRAEYIRLLEQALFKLGFSSVAQQLEAASGIQMQPASATLFQQRLLAGEWEGALQLLPQLIEGQVPAVGDEELRDARFLIRQQQYLEAVEAGDTATALDVLRCHLAPLAGTHHAHRLHHLAGLLLVPKPADVKENQEAAARWASWLGGGVAHRGHLLAQMQAALPPWLMIPEGRLEVLLEQALDTQISRCPFHNLAVGAAPGGSVAGVLALQGGLSLLSDYQAGAESLPSRCIQVLDAHTDEVWHLAFSHSGAMLATGSKDRTAIVWTVKTPPPCAPPGLVASGLLLGGASGLGPGGAPPPMPQLVHKVHTLQGHEAPVLFLSWSPDDRHLLSVSDVTLRLWDPSTGTLRHTYTHHKEAVTCCAWFPDSSRFVSGSVDRTLALLDCNGRELQRFKRAYRVQDLAVTAGGSVLVIAASDKHIHILRLSDQREVTLGEASPITSIDLSADGRYLLANLQSQAVHLWHLGSLEAPAGAPLTALAAPPHISSSVLPAAAAAATGAGALPMALSAAGASDPLDKLPGEPAAEYREPGTEANTLGRYVVRSSFGGAAGTFVVHGSEGGQVFVWHRDTATLLLRLEGHTATVNACAWPPAAPQILASASDDRTVRVWLAEAALVNSARSATAQPSAARA